MHAPVLHSVQVGLPKNVGVEGAADPMDRLWTTGLFKEQIQGPVYLDVHNLVGDEQADLHHHGGADKAVCVYPQRHYPYWTEQLEQELPIGAFGENFSVVGQDEDSACLGDLYSVGESIVQVSQPRSPCWKVARRWRVKSLALQVQETGFTGWYLRVIQPGFVEAGQELRLEERPHPDWTVSFLNRLRYGRSSDPAACSALAACETLTESWRRRFREESRLGAAENERLVGDNT